MLKLSKQLLALSAAGLCFTFTLDGAVNIPPAEEKSIQESFAATVQEPGAVMFTPPEGWFLADPKALPPNVKVMVVGKGSKDYPPSMNLSIEKFSGTLKQYLKIVKAINENKGDEWKDLGSIRTEAGDASLSQVDTKSKWGTERLMHVIFLKNGTVYILTAAALKEEFPKFYKDFFNSMRSLRINKDLFEMVKEESRRNAIQKEINDLKNGWAVYYQKFKQQPQESTTQTIAKAAFQSDNFQAQYWTPFKTMLKRDYADMNEAWQRQILDKVQEELTE